MNEKFIEVVDSLNLTFPAKEIGERMGRDKSNISKFLNNKKPISRRFLMEFCDTFNLNYSTLFKPQKTSKEIERDVYNQVLLDLLLEEVVKLKASHEKKDFATMLKEIDTLAKSRFYKQQKRLKK